MDLSSVSTLLLFFSLLLLVYGVLEVEASPRLGTKDQPYEAPSHHFKLHNSFFINGVASVDSESPPSPSASVVVTEASGLLVTSRALSTQPPPGRVLVESGGGSPSGALRVFVIVLLSSALAVIFSVFIWLICFKRRRSQDDGGQHVHYPTQATAPIANGRPPPPPPVADERGCCQPARTHPSAAAPPVANEGRGDESVSNRPSAPPVRTRPSAPPPIGNERRGGESVPNRPSAPPERTHGESAPTRRSRPRRSATPMANGWGDGGSVPTHQSAAPPAANGQGDGRPPHTHQSAAPIANGRGDGTSGGSSMEPRVRTDVPENASSIQLPTREDSTAARVADPGNTNPGPSRGVSFGLIPFDYKELQVATDDFSETNFLGEGGFAKVYKGTLSNNRKVRKVAVKRLKMKKTNADKEFENEINIISGAKHRNILSLVGYCITKTQRLIVYEFVENKSLADYFGDGKDAQVMDWAIRMKIAQGAANGLTYLHEDCRPQIIHRDVKPANILLDYKFEAKVADFGLAKLCPDSFDSYIASASASDVKGTIGFIDPAYCQTKELTFKSDVYSLGVVLLVLISGETDLQKLQKLKNWLPRILKNGRIHSLADPKLPKSFKSDEMRRMVISADACLRQDPNDRPRMKQISQVLEGTISADELKIRTRPEQGFRKIMVSVFAAVKFRRSV